MLWYLVFFGFAVNYMVRININITIVDMIQQRPKLSPTNNKTQAHPECVNEYAEKRIPNNDTDFWNKTIKRGYSIERAWMDNKNIKYDERGFLWNEQEQGLVLGSFYWLHWVTQIPGGILAQKYGTKLVFGLSNLIGCLMCALMPMVSYWDYNILIFLRVIQGLIVVSYI